MDDELQRLLKDKISELTNIIEAAERCIQESPEGLLHIKKNKETIQYYRRIKQTDTQGSYIRKSETELIEKLAQKEYAKKIYANAVIERDNLNKCLMKYHPSILKDTYNRINEIKQTFVKPYILSDEAYIAQWKEQKMKLKMQHGRDDLSLLSEEDVIITERGERVRSKSEKILADKLNRMGIPYVYECPIYLPGYRYVHPDFTTLHIKKRKEIIWEHHGMMDQNDYCEKAIKKIEGYEKNDIYPGRSLIVTYETKTHPLNMKVVEKLIGEHYF